MLKMRFEFLLAAGLLLVPVTFAGADRYSTTDPFIPVDPAVGSPGIYTEGGTFIFTSQPDFENAAMSVGKILKGVEDFEEGNVPALGIAVLADPLNSSPNVDGNGLGFPTGISATNIAINSSGGGGLVALGDGFAGNISTVVGANAFADSTILTVTGDIKTAIGLNVIDPIGGFGSYDVTVADPGGALLFSGVVSAGAANGSFLGVVAGAGTSIGSIEIAALDAAGGGGGELLDNIQLWTVPEPSTTLLGLLGVLGLIGRRRRR